MYLAFWKIYNYNIQSCSIIIKIERFARGKGVIIMTITNSVKTPLNINALAREHMKGFARNIGLELTPDDRRMFLEDFWSYRKQERLSFEEAIDLACQALLLSHK